MPHWINEGMALYYETYPGTLNPQFSNSLNRAIQNDAVPPLRTLSGTFPADSEAAVLAYAESYSVVDFIYDRYGKEKMAALFQEFKKGGDYDSIFLRVLGLSMDELDNEWRKSVGLEPRAFPTRASEQPTPFPTFSLSTDEGTPFAGATATASEIAQTLTPVSTPTLVPSPTLTPFPKFTPFTDDATPSARATATAAQVAQNSTPVSTSTTKASSGSSNPLGQICGGTFGAVVPGLFGIVWSLRERARKVRSRQLVAPKYAETRTTEL